MLHSAELKIADDFKDGDVLSASVFNQIFDTIERVSGTIKDSDLLGVWNCNAISSNSSSGWIQDGFLFKVNDAQVNLSASNSLKSIENPYSISTSNPNPFNWANTSAFTGQYILLNNCEYRICSFCSLGPYFFQPNSLPSPYSNRPLFRHGRLLFLK